MYRRALSDGCVWLAAGLACFALFFALEHWAGASPTIEFIRVFLIGLAIVTFSAATVMLVVQHRKAPQKPVSRATPSQKARRYVKRVPGPPPSQNLLSLVSAPDDCQPARTWSDEYGQKPAAWIWIC